MAEDIRKPEEVVRAERFELVGRDGATRGVFGRLGDHDGQGIYGLKLLDATGTRIEVATGPWGPSVSLVQGGNERVIVSVREGSEVATPGPAIYLCGPDGEPLRWITVEDDAPET